MAEKWYNEKEIQNFIWDQKDELLIFNNDHHIDKIKWFKEFSMGHARPDFVIVQPNSITILEIKITVTQDHFVQALKYKAAMESWLFNNAPDYGAKWNINVYLAGRYIDQSCGLINMSPFAEVIPIFKITIDEDENVDFEIVESFSKKLYSNDLTTLKEWINSNALV